MTRKPAMLGLLAITLILVLGPAWSRLPEEGLAKAQEAEQALKAGDPQTAITILVELDALYPNEPAVNLRLAEIYDQQGQSGAALYYYRRYVQLAGKAARATAKERVQTLEMTAGAREAADAIAQRLGQKVRPVGTPTPVVQQAIEKVLPDGARVRVDSPEELMSDRVNPKKLVAPTPETSQHPLSKAEVIIRESDQASSAAVAPRRTPPPVFTPPPILHPLPNLGSEENAPAGSLEKEAPSPAPQAETEAQKGHEKPAQKDTITQDAQNRVSIEFAPAERTATSKLHPTAAAGSNPRSAQTEVAGSPTLRLPVNDPEKFFIVHPSGGEQARLSLSNNLPNAVVVLSAVPVASANPINAIVGPGETRSYDVLPGRYVVHVKVTDDGYPPVTILDTRFDFDFEAGKSYARRFTNQDRARELR